MGGGVYGSVPSNNPGPFVAWQGQNKEWEPEVKRGFLTKVYSIVTCQLAVTVAFCALAMYCEPVKIVSLGIMMSGFVGLLLLLIPTIGFLVALHFYKSSYPLNLYLLGGFTLCESVLVGSVCAAHQYAAEQCAQNTGNLDGCVGIGLMVWVAWAATFAVFLSLTAFVFYSKIDFSFLGLFLFAGSIIMLLWGLVSMLLGFHMGFVYGACGAVLMSGYILYDTSNIMRRLGPDDYVIAAIEIYIDVITLFLYILQMLSSND